MAKRQWTDLDTWMRDNAGERIFRVWRYKKVFTPLEQEKKYVDQSEYADDRAMFCRLDEVVEFENGRIMFGFRDVEQDVMFEHGDLSSPAPIVYMMDGEFVMEHREGDLAHVCEMLGYDLAGEDDESGE